jgi:excinuclease ABC subunit A
MMQRIGRTDRAEFDTELAILVRGARVHNLRDLDVDLPRDRLVVLTGVSGSGKSSLAFDTLHAEGQRRYIEGLSAYARQFLEQLEPPEVDLIDGLPPTVAIDQKSGAASPRSTVATITEIHDYLRLLYARAGTPHCPNCGEPIRSQTAEQMVGSALGLGDGRKVIVLAPIVRGRKGQHLDAFRAIRRAGLIRARVDGETIELTDEPPKLAKTKTHDIEAVVDRLVVREGIRARLADSIDLALSLGDGSLILMIQRDDGSWLDRSLSTRLACPRCDLGLPEIEPRTFSFNSPYGACPSCDGLGVVSAFDPELVIPDRARSLARGAVAAWNALPPKSRTEVQADERLLAFLSHHTLTDETPLASWPARTLRAFLEGGSTGKGKPPFDGILAELQGVYEAVNERRRDALNAFRADLPCPACHGARLRPEARAVTLDGTPIHALTALTADRCRTALQSLRFEPPLDRVGTPLIAEVVSRLTFLERVGLDYLTLDRPADTLSGGELQRVRLATQIGSGLVGVCYVLDEPTAGLHPRDTERLIQSLIDLRDRGNTVLVVEHDESMIRAADWLVDLGPGAGPEGGTIVAQGPPDALVESEPGASVTLPYLVGRVSPAPSSGERLSRSPGSIRILGATEHNLKSIDVEIPTGTLTCVSGVSGSGKSTLVLEILANAARRALEQAGPKPGSHRTITGLEHIDKLIVIDQSPIGRTPRSTPATYTGLFDDIRRVYATTREARVRGYGPGRFSFNVKGGRCGVCDGQGVRRVEMTFLPDLDIPCESCRGLRFDRATLACRYKGKSIGEVLLMRVDEARDLFDNVPRVARGLDSLHEAGLGYVTLGQSSTTLSGGEAQRVKLAAELGRVATGRTLYILDEPTTGLHFADVANLLRLLNRLADLGNTVVVIEHNPEVLRAADWLIDLGPDAGENGGSVVAMSPPQAVAVAGIGHTSRSL